VHDFIRVAIGYCREQLFHVVFCLIFSDYLILNDPIKEFPSTTMFHNNVNKDLLEVDVVDMYDVGMILKLGYKIKILVFSVSEFIIIIAGFYPFLLVF